MVASLSCLIADGIAAGGFEVDDPQLAAVLSCHALHSAFDRIWHLKEMDDTD